jgi:hypothetical protein
MGQARTETWLAGVDRVQAFWWGAEEIMKERTSQLLYAYWNEVRGERVAPRRFDIEPSRITGLLPDTFILERVTHEAYLFRLAGTRICEQFGREFRGSNILALFGQADREALERVLESICKEGSVGVVTLEAADRSGKTVRLEMLLLPLVHSGVEVSRVLGSIIAAETPAWLGYEPIAAQRLKTFNLIWPDGRPHAVLTQLDRQAPFLRKPRHSRVVRSDRRSFRVYEGGRAADTLPPDSKS